MLCSTSIEILLIPWNNPPAVELEGLSNRPSCMCAGLRSTAFTQPRACAGTQHESAAAAARGRGWRQAREGRDSPQGRREGERGQRSAGDCQQRRCQRRERCRGGGRAREGGSPRAAGGAQVPSATGWEVRSDTILHLRWGFASDIAIS